MMFKGRKKKILINDGNIKVADLEDNRDMHFKLHYLKAGED